MTDEPPTAYFERLSASVFRATRAVEGAWNPEEQHIAPALGLIAYTLETDRRARRTDAAQFGRVSYDILGTLPIDEVEIETRVLRPGRTIELVEAVLSHAGRPAVLARAWFLDDYDSRGAAGTSHAAIPGPRDMPVWRPSELWPGRFVHTAEIRRVQTEPGRGAFWVRPELPLVAGEEIGATARVLGAVDIANGMTPRATPDRVAFPNVDLTVHFSAVPSGEWIGFDTTATFGGTGLGMTTSVLHDESGPIGVATQSLTVRPRG